MKEKKRKKNAAEEPPAEAVPETPAESAHACCCCSTGKSTERSDEEREKLLNRLKRIEGQVSGIRKMIENDAYCIDVLTQSAAIRGALEAFNRELLEKHLRGCVVDGVKTGREEVVDELVEILGRLVK